MNSYEAYKKYVALKLHFNQDTYDYFKFSGKVRVNKKTFDCRKDRYFFERLCKIYKEEQYEQLLVSNFIIDCNMWIGEILSDTGRKNYSEWKKRNQSLNYIFSEDLFKLKDILDKNDKDFNYLFAFTETWPEIVTLTMQKTIAIETFIIINKILNFIPHFDKKINDDLLWPDFKRMCLKYSTFLIVDLNKCKVSMKEMFLSNTIEKKA